jgi:hypothetical protein
MKNLLILGTFVLLASCSSVSLEKQLKDVPGTITHKRILPEAEARKKIMSHRNYLHFLFEQSRDPYYGTPKWSEECLTANQIGQVIEDKNQIALISELFLNSQGDAGYCNEFDGRYAGYDVWVYCRNSGELLDMTFQKQSGVVPRVGQLCD